jgi:hypothetical protein
MMALADDMMVASILMISLKLISDEPLSIYQMIEDQRLVVQLKDGLCLPASINGRVHIIMVDLDRDGPGLLKATTCRTQWRDEMSLPEVFSGNNHKLYLREDVAQQEEWPTDDEVGAQLNAVPRSYHLAHHPTSESRESYSLTVHAGPDADNAVTAEGDAEWAINKMKDDVKDDVIYQILWSCNKLDSSLVGELARAIINDEDWEFNRGVMIYMSKSLHGSFTREEAQLKSLEGLNVWSTKPPSDAGTDQLATMNINDALTAYRVI